MKNVEWYSPQYIHTEKTTDWYWIVGIITATIVIISIILGNIIFAIFILISSVTLSLFASYKPEMVLNEINQNGVKKGSMLYPYDQIDSFWVETGDKYPRLILKLKQKLSQYVILLIEIKKAEDIKNSLLANIKEEKMSESIFEKLLIYFGF